MRARTGLDDGPPNSITRGDYQPKPSVNADLLAAAKAALKYIAEDDGYTVDVIAQLTAAIKKAEG